MSKLNLGCLGYDSTSFANSAHRFSPGINGYWKKHSGCPFMLQKASESQVLGRHSGQ